MNPCSCLGHRSEFSSQCSQQSRGGTHFPGGRPVDSPQPKLRPRLRYSFTLNEVTKLSTTECAERPLAEFTPDALKGLRAVHSYNWIPGVELIVQRRHRSKRCGRRWNSLVTSHHQASNDICEPDESSPKSWAGSAIFLSSGYFLISVGGASTRLPLSIDFNSSAFTPALLSK